MEHEHAELDVAASDQASDESADVRSDHAATVERLEHELREANRALRTTERRVQIHRALAGRGALDTDAVVLVVEASLGAGDNEGAGAIARVVDDVRRTRPALFRTSVASRSAAMTANVERHAVPTPLENAAHEARRSGDRSALLRYLRLRRKA